MGEPYKSKIERFFARDRKQREIQQKSRKKQKDENQNYNKKSPDIHLPEVQEIKTNSKITKSKQINPGGRAVILEYGKDNKKEIF